MGINLLQKTELWINNITLNNANLTDMANCLADILKIERSKILVVDVRYNNITFDIIEKDIPHENIIGKEKAILEQLSHIKGVNLSETTYIYSNGILGTICLHEENASEIIENISKMENEIRHSVSKRAIVYPTGFEIQQKMIEDTNTPYLKGLLEEEGYKVTIGPVIDDDLDIATYQLSDAVSRGFGLIITTGGVGAEDKDKNIEALLNVIPEASIEYVVKFQQGTGRHVKDGVRIGVGQIGPSIIVTLPGPNDEVRLTGPILLEGLKNKNDTMVIAKKLSDILMKKLLKRNDGYWNHNQVINHESHEHHQNKENH